MSEIICYCKNVSKCVIVEAIKNGAKSLNEIKQQTGACTGSQCKKLNPSGKCCSADINNLLNKPETPEDCACCS